MKRRLLQLCFALGLLLTLATGVLSVRGYWVADWLSVRWHYTKDGRPAWQHIEIASSQYFLLMWIRVDPASPSGVPPDGFRFRHGTGAPRGARSSDSDPLWRRLGFFWSRDRFSNGIAHAVKAPSWFVLLTCLTATSVSAFALRREQRRAARGTDGLCPTCGYDLRGAAHERCPECGAAVAVARV